MEKAIIHTERLSISPLDTSDATELFRYRSHPNIQQYQSFQASNIEEAFKFIQDSSGEFNVEDTWYQLGIFSQSDLIGDIGLHFIGPKNLVCEIGYTIAYEHQRQGFAKEAIHALINYLFTHLKKHRVVANLSPGNIASIALLNSLSFRKEGLSQQSELINGRWEDNLSYAMLKSEFSS